MPKQQITIEIDVPEGFDAGPVDVLSLESYSKVLVHYHRRWQWPDFIKVDWVAMDEDGEWYAFMSEPQLNVGYWSGNRILLSRFTNFQSPPCTDWRLSKRRRPVS